MISIIKINNHATLPKLVSTLCRDIAINLHRRLYTD